MNANDGLTGSDTPPVVWMTGLPGAGKSTIARALHAAMVSEGAKVVVLDGDTLREGLCSDLGFSDTDRIENVRRIAHVAKLFQQTGHVVVVATISPLAIQRESRPSSSRWTPTSEPLGKGSRQELAPSSRHLLIGGRVSPAWRIFWCRLLRTPAR